MESDFLTMVVMLVVIEYRFYVTSKRLVCFNSTFIIIAIDIKIIISGGGVSSPKIYFPKSDDDFKQLVGRVGVAYFNALSFLSTSLRKNA